MTIQVFLPVGGENGILVKKIFENTNFSTFKYFFKIPKSPPKIGTFQNKKKIEVEKMV